MPFNVGFGELMLIMLVALIVFGPGKLPEIGGAIGRAMQEFRRASSELTDELTREVAVKKELDRQSTTEASVEVPAPYVPAQTQAYSQEPAMVSSENLLASPDNGLKPAAEAPTQPPTVS
ncbi:MAG: twin-arginine translocase TatA/TatE family subunit [Dehalococcoidia bacterium]|nr:twin-arginine translocase TatA/TatE family subunit [Dehalococcoidia bacterium]